MTGTGLGNGASLPLDRMVRDAGLRAAIGYWEGLRGGRRVPSRMDLDPAQMRPYLQNTAILEVARPGSVRLRLGGGRINALMGMDIRGMPLRALFDLADRGRITEATERALDDPSVLLVEAMAPAPRYGAAHTDRSETQIAILPLADTEGGVTRALYVMGEVEGPGTRLDAPLRWSIRDTWTVRIVADQPLLTVETLAPSHPRAPAFADEAASETRGAFARARFRVIEGGLA